MQKVLYEKRNRIGYVTLNRPDALNALDDQINEELWSVTDALSLETINAYSSLGDFSEARERLARFYARGKETEKA